MLGIHIRIIPRTHATCVGVACGNSHNCFCTSMKMFLMIAETIAPFLGE